MEHWKKDLSPFVIVIRLLCFVVFRVWIGKFDLVWAYVFRSSRRRCSIEKAVFKNFAIFTGKLYFKFYEIWRTTVLINICKLLLLCIGYHSFYFLFFIYHANVETKKTFYNFSHLSATCFTLLNCEFAFSSFITQ